MIEIKITPRDLISITTGEKLIKHYVSDDEMYHEAVMITMEDE